MTTPSTSFYTDFIPVNRKKRKNKSRPAKEPLLAIIQRLRDELLSAQDNDWLPQCQQIITESFVDRPAPEQIICLGLGSPAASPNARAQLAFLIVISQYLHIVST
ncbi:hypothetical protein J132_02789 [Termitomyces sp. J132]|nr:hypothetical protein C0989_003720 [Termitomyces sp. Mn162]KNZ75456.1 hypothetical protein J132_02789 [Termitomyces sp. J132]